MQSVETFRKGHDPMRRPRTAAGKRLVDSMHEALARTSAETGRTLVWSEQEEAALELNNRVAAWAYALTEVEAEAFAPPLVSLVPGVGE